MEFGLMAPLAFAAGVLSFTSPCALPLMPGYVSYISTGAGPGQQQPASRSIASAALFVGGFTVVFTALGAGASAVSGVLLENRTVLAQVGGATIILFGLVVAGAVRLPVLMRERRLDLSRIRPGPAGALPLGMAFAIGWVPCVGPVLASILTLAAAETSVAEGAMLLTIYSAGLGLPFIGLATAASRLGPVVRFLRRRARAVELVGGGLLVAMGLLLVTNQWTRLFAPLLRRFAEWGWPPI
jgi:cytochrome c-type biogenesis protein